MSQLIIPENYKALLSLQQTEIAIKTIKDFFLSSISTELRLRRVTAPLFVLKGLGYEKMDNSLVSIYDDIFTCGLWQGKYWKW